MDDSVTWPGTASLEDRDIMVSQALQRTVELLLFVQCALGVDWLDPLGRGTAVRCQEARLDAVAVELPAGIVVDAFQAKINPVATGYVGKGSDQVTDVRDQQVAHVICR